MEMSTQFHVPTALPPRKRPRSPLDRRLGVHLSHSGRSGTEKKCLGREGNLMWPVDIPTELSPFPKRTYSRELKWEGRGAGLRTTKAAVEKSRQSRDPQGQVLMTESCRVHDGDLEQLSQDIR
jgi:hypothetical protein